MSVIQGFSLGHALERKAKRGGFYWEKWFTELQASSKVNRDRMQRLRNQGDSMQCSLLFTAALRFSMRPPKPMPSTPITEGKILLFQHKKHDAMEYRKYRSAVWKKPQYITIRVSSLHLHIIRNNNGLLFTAAWYRLHVRHDCTLTEYLPSFEWLFRKVPWKAFSKLILIRYYENKLYDIPRKYFMTFLS